MTTTLETSDGDLTFGLVHDNDATIQMVAERLRLWQGEWFLDAGAGVPYFAELVNRRENQRALTILIRDTVLSTPNVEEALVSRVSLNRATRRMTIEVDVTTDWGDEAVSAAIAF